MRQAANNSWSQKLYSQAGYAQQTMNLQKAPEIVAAVEKCYYTNEPLTLTDLILLESYLASGITDFRTDYLHFEKGLISEESWNSRKSSIQYWFGADYPKIWWENFKHVFEESFINEIDDLISAAPDIKDTHVKMLAEINRMRGMEK